MAQIWRSQNSAGSAVWGPSNGATGGAPAAPSSVSAAPASGTSLTLSVVDASGAAHRWQIAPAATGIFVDATGATNPSAPGLTTFPAAGQVAATECRVRARAESAGGNSAWVEAATTVWTDNTGTGGGTAVVSAGIIGAGGIPSAEAFGVPTVTVFAAANIIGAGGIPSAEAFGVPTVSTNGVALIADAGGIPSAEAFGVPTVVATGSGSGSGTGATAEQIAAAVWQHVVESGFSAEQLLRVIAAPLAGRATGIGTNVESYLAVGGTVPRVVASFDANGNRESVAVDGSTV